MVALLPPFLGRAGRPAAVLGFVRGGVHCGLSATKHSVITRNPCPRIKPEAELSWKRHTLTGEQVAVQRGFAECSWPAGLEEGQVQIVVWDEGH